MENYAASIFFPNSNRYRADMWIFMIGYVFQIIGLYVITYLIGYPVCFLCNKKTIWKYRQVIIPISGMTIGMIGMYYLNLLQLPVEQIFIPMTCFFLVVDFVLLIYKIRNESLKQKNNYSTDNIIQWFFAISLLLLFSVIFLLPGVNNNGNLSILLGNNDYVLYTATSNAVKYAGETEARAIGGITTYWWAYGDQPRLIDFWIAYTSCAFNINIFNSAYLVTIFGLIISCLSIFALTEEICGNKWLGLVAAVALGFNCNSQYIIYQGFIAQVVSIAYMVIISLFVIMMLKEDKTCWKISLLSGLSLAGLSSTYSEMVPLIIGPVCFLLAIRFFINRHTFLPLLFNYFIVALTLAVIFPHGYNTVFQMLKYSNTQAVGWDIEPGYLLQALGLYNSHFHSVMNEFIGCPKIILIGVSIIIFIYLIYYIVRYTHDIEKSMFISFVASFVMFYLVFLLKYDQYKAFKGLMNMSYIFIVILILAIANSIKRSRIRILPLFVCIVVAFSFLRNGLAVFFVDCAYSEAIQDGFRISDGNVIGKPQEELTTFFDETDYEKIYYSGQPVWEHVAAITIGMQEKRAACDLNGSILYDPGILPDDDSIVICTSLWTDPVYISGEKLLENDVYKILRVNSSYPFCTNPWDIGPIFIAQTNKAIATRQFSRELTSLNFYLSQDGKHDLFVDIGCVEERTMRIILPDGRTEQQLLQVGHNNIEIKDICFLKGSNTISFDFSNLNSEVYLWALSFDDKVEPDDTNLIYPDYSKYHWITIKGFFEMVSSFFSSSSLTATGEI